MAAVRTKAPTRRVANITGWLLCIGDKALIKDTAASAVGVCRLFSSVPFVLVERRGEVVWFFFLFLDGFVVFWLVRLVPVGLACFVSGVNPSDGQFLERVDLIPEGERGTIARSGDASR